MKKISIVTPVFNEEKNIVRYFDALNKIKYPRDNFELIIVNDGSADNSLKILEQEKEKSNVSVQIINFTKNKGWIIARETGAREAKYENLLFFDCKCEIFPDALDELVKLNYQPINGNSVQKEDSVFDIFFLLIRRVLYKNQCTSSFDDFLITKKNFDSSAKGTTIFFCDKTLFLESLPQNKTNKATSDDIKLLRNVLEKKEILKTSKVKVFYNTRKTVKDNIKHLMTRGPRFVDYYYKWGQRYFWPMNFGLGCFLLIIFLLIAQIYLFEMVSILILSNIMIALYLARNIKDFLIVFLLFPVVSIVFLIGIIKGLFIKFLHL
ncbi:glycosyltransferase family 2 protein [bacterium]|jgi:glycosyltransferase involved in cell wall biosynthesis|nr:glycosyltransferase family 2 protein [bacterium]MBT6832265.1 glycosyltransferase family 2 protein [bacterium]MBT6996202.1 glycosyltransferase family 2 protein [bacterium]MBT7772449.1 glycosyltransferase family 2 protein [bacterium]